jgi:polysaccharide biosynthesis/export protein
MIFLCDSLRWSELEAGRSWSMSVLSKIALLFASARWRSIRPDAFALAVLLGAIFLGCASERPYVWVQQAEATSDWEPGSKIRVGDRIYVLVRGHDQLSGEFEVRADGSYVQPIVGTIRVAGKTPKQAALLISRRLKGVLERPEVSVAALAPRPPTISVLGQVTEPGRFEITSDEGVLSALARAKGLTIFADRDGIYVLRKQPRAMRIRFRYGDLTGGEKQSLGFRLRDGDVVVVE